MLNKIFKLPYKLKALEKNDHFNEYFIDKQYQKHSHIFHVKREKTTRGICFMSGNNIAFISQCV